MGRKRRQQGGFVSLFPFLSVLACVIGTLTLLLSALALGQLGSRTLSHVRLLERQRALLALVADARVKLAEIERDIAAGQRLEKERRTDIARLEALGLPSDLPLEELENIARVREKARALPDRRQKLESREKELRHSVEALESQLAERQKRRRGLPIVIDPSGFAHEQRPYFVECGADHLELHRVSGDWHYRIPKEDIALSDDFKTFLHRVRAIRNGLVVFLIRPDGVASYDLAAALARQQRTRSAHLPLPGAGRLDFSLLREEGGSKEGGDQKSGDQQSGDTEDGRDAR